MRTRHRLSVAFVLLALALSAPLPAPAATLSWTNAAGGFAGVASNWNPVSGIARGAGLYFARAEIAGRAGREVRTARVVRLPQRAPSACPRARSI